MHIWGDSWFKKHGKDLDLAINFCGKTLRKFGRIGVYGKEKYGVYRQNTTFWDGGIWSLFFPGHQHIKPGFWNFIYFKVDWNITYKVTKYTGIHWLGLKYQYIVYNYVMQKACKLYPDIIDEIIMDSSHYELIKPGIFGNINGEDIHNKYWKKI